LKDPARPGARRFHRVAATFCLTAALFFAAFPCEALTVEGLPDWLTSHALRGLTAVWEEIPPMGGEARFDTLTLVARRLFMGYRVTIGRPDAKGEPRVFFEAQDAVAWEVQLVSPDLRPPASSWFADDEAGLKEGVGKLLEGLPVDALSWAGEALHGRIAALVEARFPGWTFSLLVRLEDGRSENKSSGENKGRGILQLALRPDQPLVLAVMPSIYSSTLPLMFQSDLSARLLSGLSPIIGLPVRWIDRHRGEVELLVRDFLEDRNAVSNTRSQVEVTFVPDQISRLEADVESERFIFRLWMAGYAGMKERYPEAGVLLGWNAKRDLGIDVEFYGELILDVGELELTGRLGGSIPLWKNFRVGLEVEWPDERAWYRVAWTSARIRRPYAWWRWNPTRGHNAALGYRLTEYISIELHYDDRWNDRLGLKGILLL
jgi:hypothetical protein